MTDGKKPPKMEQAPVEPLKITTGEEAKFYRETVQLNLDRLLSDLNNVLGLPPLSAVQCMIDVLHTSLATIDREAAVAYLHVAADRLSITTEEEYAAYMPKLEAAFESLFRIFQRQQEQIAAGQSGKPS